MLAVVVGLVLKVLIVGSASAWRSMCCARRRRDELACDLTARRQSCGLDEDGAHLSREGTRGEPSAGCPRTSVRPAVV